MIKTEISRDGMIVMMVKDEPRKVALAEKALTGVVYTKQGDDTLVITIPQSQRYMERIVRRTLNRIGIMPW